MADPGMLAYVKAHQSDASLDLTWDVDRLFQAAIYWNPALQAARQNVEVARAEIERADMRPNPTFSVLPAYDVTSGVPTPWLTTVMFDIPIETAGKRSARHALADQRVQASDWRALNVAWSLRAAARRAVLGGWEAWTTLETLEAQKAAQGQVVSLMRARVDAGDAAGVEWVREQAILDRLEVPLAEARGREQVSLAALVIGPHGLAHSL